MPEIWEYPTVSMGLGPIMGIYQAASTNTWPDRGLKEPANNACGVSWGDGECDEPETLGAITLASREELDNLVFVINCNLQRLDGPFVVMARSFKNSKVLPGAGWNVIKVVWAINGMPILEKDETGLLAKRMVKSSMANIKNTSSKVVPTFVRPLLWQVSNCSNSS